MTTITLLCGYCGIGEHESCVQHIGIEPIGHERYVCGCLYEKCGPDTQPPAFRLKTNCPNHGETPALYTNAGIKCKKCHNWKEQELRTRNHFNRE